MIQSESLQFTKIYYCQKRSSKYETYGNHRVWWHLSKTTMLGIEYVQYWKGDSRKQRKCHGICIDVSDYLGLITFFIPERKKVALFLFVVTRENYTTMNKKIV